MTLDRHQQLTSTKKLVRRPVRSCSGRCGRGGELSRSRSIRRRTFRRGIALERSPRLMPACVRRCKMLPNVCEGPIEYHHVLALWTTFKPPSAASGRLPGALKQFQFRSRFFLASSGWLDVPHDAVHMDCAKCHHRTIGRCGSYHTIGMNQRRSTREENSEKFTRFLAAFNSLRLLQPSRNYAYDGPVSMKFFCELLIHC